MSEQFVYRFKPESLRDRTTVSYVFARRCGGKTTLANHLLLASGAQVGFKKCWECEPGQFDSQLKASEALQMFINDTSSTPCVILFDDCVTNHPQRTLHDFDYRRLLQCVRHHSDRRPCTLLLTCQFPLAVPLSPSDERPDYVFLGYTAKMADIELAHKYYASEIVPRLEDFVHALLSVTMHKYGQFLVVARQERCLFWYNARGSTLL